MSDTFFKNIHISNFKSLKDVTLSDCKQINLLIGKPNVGKSNILEAIGLFSLPYLKYNESKSITPFIRLENIAELFFNGNINEKISIISNDDSHCHAYYLEKYGLIEFEILLKNQCNDASYVLKEGDRYTVSVDNKLNLDAISPGLSDNIYPFLPKVKSYKYFQNQLFVRTRLLVSSLLPPNGINVFDTIQANKELKTELSHIFSEYNLKLVFDTASHSLKILKNINDEEVFLLPYNSMADTLQRVIFFKTAIASNKNSILLFEEPEAHCFPPYIAHFTQDVLNSETNQFFIATHSPYVLNDFLENQRDEVAIFMANFKDGQTVIYRLTDDEVNEVYNDGIDVFFNYERYTQHG